MLFYRFSIQNPERNGKWIETVGRKCFTPTKHSRLCNKHLLNSDFKTSVGIRHKRLLRDDHQYLNIHQEKYITQNLINQF